MRAGETGRGGGGGGAGKPKKNRTLSPTQDDDEVMQIIQRMLDVLD